MTDFLDVVQLEALEMLIVIKSQVICYYDLSLNQSILCRCHIIDLKTIEKPYKIFEVKK